MPPPSEERDHLVARIVRDLRTPLNDILGYAELLSTSVTDELPPSVKPFVEAMCASGELLRGTLDDIGDLALLRAAVAEKSHPLHLIDLSPDLSVVLVDGRIVYANAAALRMLGLPALDVAKGRLFADFVHVDWRSLADDNFSSLTEERGRVPLKLVDARGRKLDVEMAASPLQADPDWGDAASPAGGTWVLLVGRDVGGMLAAATAVRAREARIRAIMDCVQDGIITIDVRGRIETCNVTAATMFGYEPDDIIGMNVSVLMTRREAAEHDGHLERYAAGGPPKIIGAGREVVGRHRTGAPIPLYLTVQETVIGNERLFTGTLRNLSREKELAARAEHAERHDALTSLPNRREFIDRLDAVLAGHSGPALVAVSDINGLTAVNEAHGYETGNRLLLEVAGRVRQETHGKGPCARVAGGSFALVLPLCDGMDASEALEVLQAALSESVLATQNGDLRVTSRVGGAIYPDHGTTGRDLLRRAEIAVRQLGDDSDRSWRLYDKSMTFLLSERLSLERAIRVALEEKQFFLDYQPQIDLATGSIIGVEALLRWRHPEIGLISPGRFIPVAEASDLILHIGTFALEEACRQAAQWIAAGIDPPRMGVNLSARQFADPHLQERVLRALAESGLPPQKLELELTEGLLMQSADHTLRVLGGFADMGLSIAVDDFGTGYSSLAYLKRFPVSTLKIDRAFVVDVHRNEEDRAIAAAIISLARSLGLSTIAEGIELPEQASVLKSLGCREVQGFLYARPMPPKNVAELLRAGPLTGHLIEEMQA